MVFPFPAGPFGFVPFGFPGVLELAYLNAPLYGVPPTYYPFVYDPARAPFLPRL